MKKTKSKLLMEKLEPMFEMANFRQKTTGLPMIVWLSIKSGNEKHGPRIKVQNNHDSSFNVANTVSVTISDDPQMIPEKGLSKSDFLAVCSFIKENKTELLKYWNGETDTAEFLKNMKKVV